MNSTYLLGSAAEDRSFGLDILTAIAVVAFLYFLAALTLDSLERRKKLKARNEAREIRGLKRAVDGAEMEKYQRQTGPSRW